jgi:aminoglycoside phosphotransferase (APT) family kinase protein
MTEVLTTEEPSRLVFEALGVQPLRVVQQGLSESGKAVYRVDLPDDTSAALRTSVRPNTFAFTRRNLDALRRLGVPVQSVLARGPTASGGSFILLSWLPGHDLVHELSAMSRAQMTRLAERVVECQRRVGRLPQATRFGWAAVGRNGVLDRWTQVFGEPASSISVNDGTLIGGLRAGLCTLRGRVESYFDTLRPIPFLDDHSTKNVLIENGRLSGIIDVDYVCYGDPLMSVGATMASIAGEFGEWEAFYGEELIRCWNPSPDQLLAIWFYAALWAIGSIAQTDHAAHPARADSLIRAARLWLSLAEDR